MKSSISTCLGGACSGNLLFLRCAAFFCLLTIFAQKIELQARYESPSAGELIFTQRFGPHYAGYSSWMSGRETRFGESVAVHGDYIVVGAPGANARGGGPEGVKAAGRVYIFKRERGLWFRPNPAADEWGVYSTDNMSGFGARLVQVLESPHAVPGGDFGASISFNGDWLIIGAPGEFVPSESPEIGDVSRSTRLLVNNFGWSLDRRGFQFHAFGFGSGYCYRSISGRRTHWNRSGYYQSGYRPRTCHRTGSDGYDNGGIECRQRKSRRHLGFQKGGQQSRCLDIETTPSGRS
ncbi:MAG: FG-GAP repeat protein [Verrucomicrobia bacterium]|nr:FG-GAP repeat protein [Verrucomicrobiota bacterium]